jgi:hypothetical protein
VTDALPSLLKAFVILAMWLEQTFRMVLCVVHVLIVRTRRNTLPEKSFTLTCFGKVTCLAIIVGPSTEKDGVGRAPTQWGGGDQLFPHRTGVQPMPPFFGLGIGDLLYECTHAHYRI